MIEADRRNSDVGTNARGQTRLALRFVKEHRDKVIFVPGLGWHCWTGTHWEPDTTGMPKRLAIKTVIKARNDAANLEREYERKQLWKDTTTCDNDSGLNGMLSIAESLAGIATSVYSLDQDPFLFNTKNGTLDLRTGELRRHLRSDLITKVAGCEYDPLVEGVTFLRFLSEVLPDEEVRDFVQRLVGYSMLGLVREHILPLFIGAGRNGKGNLLHAILDAFGSYGMSAASTLLLERNSNAATTDQVDLMGRRMVVCSETDEGQRFAAATVKKLTGGDIITARKMYKDNIQFTPSHTIFLMTNHEPRTDGSDMAMFERIKKVEFNQTFVGSRQDPFMAEKLSLESNVVLRWAVEGYQKYTEHGLYEPVRVSRDTKRYKLNNDPLGRFMDERCVIEEFSRTTSSDIYDAWVQWNGGSSPITQMAFSIRLEERGFKKARSRKGIVFNGIALAPDPYDDSE